MYSNGNSFQETLDSHKYRLGEYDYVAHVNIGEHERVPDTRPPNDLLKGNWGLPEVAVHLWVTAVYTVIWNMRASHAQFFF